MVGRPHFVLYNKNENSNLLMISSIFIYQVLVPYLVLRVLFKAEIMSLVSRES